VWVRVWLRRRVQLMAVHIDELTSDVSVEPAPGAQQPQGAQRPWDALAQFAELRRKAFEDALRTRAEAFDD
jgi:hypothetical protein